MMGKSVRESGMDFGPFPHDTLFQIENSALIKRLGAGLKVSEMVVFWQDKICVIEAKSSSPKNEDLQRFSEFCAEIREKLQNSLLLTFAMQAGRHGEKAQQELPVKLREAPTGTEVLFLLVIRGHQKGWLPPIQDGLNRALSTVLRCFGTSKLLVLNDEQARTHGLVAASTGPE